MQNQSWSTLANLLVQRGRLSFDVAAAIAKVEPSSSLVWMDAFLERNDAGFTASSLAQWMSDTAGLVRLSPREWQTFLNHRPTQSPRLPHAPQGLVWLGGSPACLGIVDASDSAVLQRLRFLINAPFEWRVLSMDEYYQSQKKDNASAVQRFSAQVAPSVSTLALDANFNANPIDSNDAPVVRYIQDLLVQMVRERASDLHFEPFSNHFRIRARIDGVLHDVAQLDAQLKEQMSVRLKVMAQLDIAEKRLPQDGRIKLVLSAAETVDCRISTLPTLFGEKIVVRFLNGQTTALGLAALGYEPDQLAILEEALTRPYGLILMTGPTGSGKTVSLYGCLQQLNTDEVNISTVEDPVEIFMTGINQVSINEKAGIDFATALRAFLRQDPDILMVGEIRDLDTADIALKAAQTGHLVFSTLHTNDAPLALTRLAQMGVTPYNIAASVSVITAQRLVRQLCDCKVPIRLDEALLLSAGFTVKEAKQKDWQAFSPKGCNRCHHTGFFGRIGVFQVMPVSINMQNLIARNCSAQELREQARAEGVLNLREAGLLKVKAGLCALNEIMVATI